MKALGDQAVWLEHGEIRAIGRPDSVCEKYMAAMASKDNNYRAHLQDADGARRTVDAAHPPADIIEGIPNVDHRFGDGRAKLLGIAVCDSEGRRLQSLESDKAFLIRLSFRAHERLERPIAGVTFRDHRGLDFAGSNTDNEGYPLPPVNAGEICTVDFHLELPSLYTDSLAISPAIADGSAEHHAVCDWIDNAVVMPMTKPEGLLYGHLRFPCRIEVNAHLGAKESEQVTAS